jgi:hypothetical protein
LLGFSVSAQSLKTFDLDQNTSLDLVLSEISNNNDILFAYPTELINDVEINNIYVEYDSNAELIREILKQTNLEMYAMSEQHFLLRQKHIVHSSSVTINGIVIDSKTGEGLPFATVFQEDFSDGVFTDIEGKFHLECDKDNSSDFIVSFLGYKDLKISIDELISSKTINLTQENNIVENVMITYIVPPSFVSDDGQYIQLGAKLLNLNTSGILGSDILRNIQLTAGVSAHEDDMASLKIRGSNAEGSKIILDGIPLYNVNHYYGIFSNINSQFINKAQLYKNAQPTQYKDASGGLLVLTSNDNMLKKKNNIDVNLLTGSAYIEEDLTDNIKFMVAGRTSYGNVNDARLIDIGNGGVQQFVDNRNQTPFFSNQPKFNFYDINGSLKFSNKNLEISGNVFTSNDELVNVYELNSQRLEMNNASASYVNYESWQNTGFSFLTKYNFQNNWTLSSTVFTSQYNYEGFVNSELRRNQTIQKINNNNTISLRESGVNLFMQKQSESNSFLGGISFNNFDANHQLEIDSEMPVLNYRDDISYVTFYGEYEYTFDRLIAKAGMRVPFSKQKDKFKFFYSPLVSLTYKLSESQKLKASYNYSNQIVRELEYENRLGQNYSFYRLSKGKQFPVLKTHKFMLGYSAEWNKFTFDVEAYYKNIDGAMQLLNPLTGFDDSGNGLNTDVYQLFIGERRVRGIDFTLGYQFDKLYSGIAYTLSKSEDKYRNLFKGQYFLSQNDRRHQFKWINTFRINNFDFNFNMIYANGTPYIPFENLDGVKDKGKLDPNKNQKQLPAYLRMDIGANYNFQISKIDARFGISIFNLANRQNVKYVQYSHKINTNGPNNNDSIVIGTGADLLDRTLNINFGISF